VETMKSMVKAFAEYANAPEVQLHELDINEIVREVSDLYRGMDADLKLQLQLDRLLPSILGDAARVRQVLVNLIKNAMEAQRDQEKSNIEIHTRHVRHHGYDYVELRIEDQGPGIDAEVLEHLYEPYVSTKPKGGGLGLAIVKKIIEEHGGVVRVSNKADRGALVIIQFPLPEGVVRGSTTGEFESVSKVV